MLDFKTHHVYQEKRQDSYWINLSANDVCVSAAACAHSNSQDIQRRSGVFFGGGFSNVEVSLSLLLRLHSQNQP